MAEQALRRRATPLARAVAAVAVGLLGLVPLPASAVPLGPAPAAQQADPTPQLPVDPDADPDRARRTADDILSGREYQAPEQGGRSILDRIREWFGDLVPDISGPGGRTLDGASLVIVGVVVVGALSLLGWVLARTRRARPAPDDVVDAEVEVTPLRTPTQWSAEADRCEAAGDHRGAVRARFRSLTSTLVDRDLVVDAPGRTVGELRVDLAERAPEAGPAFAPLADLFERVWFGSSGASADDSATARRLAAAAAAAAPRRPRASASVGAPATGTGTDPAPGAR